VSIDTIGSFAALVFSRKEDFLRKRIDLAGDELTGKQFAEVLTKTSLAVGAVREKKIMVIKCPHINRCVGIGVF
jgi:hypothetical protein